MPERTSRSRAVALASARILMFAVWVRTARGCSRSAGSHRSTAAAAKRDVAATTAAHPQEPAQIDPGLRGRRWIEHLLGVDEGGGLAALRDVAQTRDEKARAPRRRPAHDLGDLPASHSHALHTPEN